MVSEVEWQNQKLDVQPGDPRAWATQWSGIRRGAEWLKGTDGGRADRLAEFGRGRGRAKNPGETGDFMLDKTSGGLEKQGIILFQTIQQIRSQQLLTLSGQSVEGAHFHPLKLHENAHTAGWCSRLRHLVRRTVGLGLQGDGLLSPVVWHWLVHCDRLYPAICSRHWHALHATRWWLAGIGTQPKYSSKFLWRRRHTPGESIFSFKYVLFEGPLFCSLQVAEWGAWQRSRRKNTLLIESTRVYTYVTMDKLTKENLRFKYMEDD